MKINKNRTSTVSTESMRNPLIPKLITFERLIALMPFDLGGFGVDEQIAILGADGTVATVDLVGCEVGQVYAVFDGAAVATGIVPEFRG